MRDKISVIVNAECGRIHVTNRIGPVLTSSGYSMDALAKLEFVGQITGKFGTLMILITVLSCTLKPGASIYWTSLESQH